MKITYRIIIACLIACMPVAAITLTENAAIRVPDIYRSQFKSAETAAETGLSINDEQLADFFSEFMKGNLETFDLRESVESLASAEESDFRTGEQMAMEKARRLLNQNLYGGIAALLVGVFAFFFTWKKGYHEALRWAVKISFALWAGMWAAFAVAVFRPGGKEAMLRYIYGYTIGPGSLLYQILTTELYRIFVLITMAGSLILMVIFSWVIYKVTKPKKMFAGN